MTHMTDQERAEFEHWYSSEGKQPEVLTKVGESTIYKDSYTGVAWAAWQAARRAPVVQPTVAQVEEAVGMSSTAWDCIEPQAIIDAVMKLAGFGASVVPQFSQVAKKKLDYLLEAGEEITGYAIQNKDGRRGAIDCHGFVYWWNDAAAPQPPEGTVNESLTVQLDDTNAADMPQAVDFTHTAPVQLPEPVAFALEWTFNGEERGMRLYDDETHCRFDAESDGGVCHPLYTEHQVRQLLAAQTHGITQAKQGGAANG